MQILRVNQANILWKYNCLKKAKRKNGSHFKKINQIYFETIERILEKLIKMFKNRK